jgi:hypothetical protein
MTEKDMEQITKEWPEEFLVPVADVELSSIDTIGSPIVTRVEHVEKSSGMKKKKKKEEVQDIESDEEDNTSEDNGSGSIRGGGEDEEEGQGGGDEREEDKGGRKYTPPEDPPTGTITPQKRKVSEKKPSTRKKTHTNNPQLEATLTVDDISLVHGSMEDIYEDILQRYGEKQEEIYGRIKKDLKEVHQATHLVRAVPTAPSLS